MRAPLPADEEVRIASLRAQDILDSPAERAFDDIAQLAQLICGVPIALVSFVDQDRQWFKARIGLEVQETPRDQSFCAHALTSRETLVIEDTSDDPRFAENPLVQGGPRIRSYAGVPIYVDDGDLSAVGTLCVLDKVPRKLTSEQLTALAALARRVEIELGLRRKVGTAPKSASGTGAGGAATARPPNHAEVSLAEGEVIAARYRIDRLIGSGGMGRVYRAVDAKTSERVAIKVMGAMAVTSAEATERFVREARALLRITSPHVARLLDAGNLEHGAPYLVMEYLVGNDLTHERPPVRVDRAVSLAMEACEGVAAIHAAGVVHRDLKPGNLFLARSADDTTILKVLDFGISKLVTPDVAADVSAEDGALTNASAVLGSPRFMSPEQLLSSRDVDTATDIWALGILLYELLTHAHPFEGTSITEICASIFTKKPRSMREAAPDIPAALDAVVLRCIARDKAERWPTARALRDALAALA